MAPGQAALSRHFGDRYICIEVSKKVFLCAQFLPRGQTSGRTPPFSDGATVLLRHMRLKGKDNVINEKLRRAFRLCQRGSQRFPKAVNDRVADT